MNERTKANFFKRLSNRERLDVLRQVVLAMSNNGLTVGEISDQINLKQPATSQYLAQLENECGLVRSSREGRYVYYRFAADESFDVAAKLGPALRKYLRDEAAKNHFMKVHNPDPPFLATFSALANEDRTKVAMLLREKGEVTKTDVQAALKLTELNARRHLATLCELGLLESVSPSFRWREPADPISRLALSL